jgi:ribosomal protein S18 acetylase RimI-like enzyme
MDGLQMIINARQVDQNIVVLLIHQAIGDLVNIFTASWNMKKALSVMNTLYNTSQTRFSMEHSSIMIEDGVVVGQVMAYPAENMVQLNENTLETVSKQYEGADYEFFLLKNQILKSKEAFEGEYYIDNLAVMPAFRGKGIGSKLIAHVEKSAQEKGYSKVSILADEENDKAYKLYKSLGFVEDTTLKVLGHTYRHMVKNL